MNENIWNSVLEKIKSEMGFIEYSKWIANSKIKEIKQNSIDLQVESDFIKKKIELYQPLILSKIKEVTKEEFDLKISIKKTQNFSVDCAVNFDSGLNSNYTFDTFVIGKSNEFACAAAKRVASSPGTSYNPLFVYGGPGLGKTHLLQAIGNYIKSKELKIYYCSSEQFTNDLINSIKNGKIPDFRKKYRELDALLIDDIQFIFGKERTLEEFFHTFNFLHQNGKQIVISSDRSTNEMKNVEERLVSRFVWGLITDIRPPDYETRVAILRNKAERELIKISEGCVNYIAEMVHSNIRELEGVLNRVLAKSLLLGKSIDIDLIDDILDDFIDRKIQCIGKDKVIRTVTHAYGVSIEELISSSRKRDIMLKRQIVMYFLKNISKLPYSVIGGIFGGKDHTTVMHGVNKIDKMIKSDKNFHAKIMEIQCQIMRY